ncbi:MAG TPA: DUF2277 domain-containing protein [Longimicrobiales bacterium]
MCRNIKPLFNYEPAVTDAEVRASALQYVRKVSGFTKPSRANEAAFEEAVAEVTRVTQALLDSLTTTAEPRDRATEIAKLKAKSAERYGRSEASA